jgi:hypothetical protein
MPYTPQAGVKIEKESKLGSIATIIAALVVVLITVVAARASFPVYLYYGVVISLLVAIFALLIYGFLAHPIYIFLKRRREIRKHNVLARKYFGEFTHFTERFGEFLEQKGRDGKNDIPSILHYLHNNEAFITLRDLSLPPSACGHLFNCYKERLKRFDRTMADFSLLVGEFESILELYNNHCICNQVAEIRRIGLDKVSEGIKEEYRTNKGLYERFIGGYTDFGKKLNKEFGERISGEYFEMPKEL